MSLQLRPSKGVIYLLPWYSTIVTRRFFEATFLITATCHVAPKRNRPTRSEEDRSRAAQWPRRESTDRSVVDCVWKGGGAGGGEERRRVGEGFCNGKLRREKVVKRGRVVGRERKDRVEEALIWISTLKNSEGSRGVGYDAGAMWLHLTICLFLLLLPRPAARDREI